MSELAALAGGLLIGWLFTRTGAKVPVYVPASAAAQVQSLPSALQIATSADNPLITRQVGWPSFGAGRTMSDRDGIGNSPQVLPPSVIAQQIQIKAAPGNTDIIWVGTGVLAGEDSYPMAAGDGLSIPVQDKARPTMFSKTAAQKLYWAVVR